MIIFNIRELTINNAIDVYCLFIALMKRKKLIILVDDVRKHA